MRRPIGKKGNAVFTEITVVGNGRRSKEHKENTDE